MTKPTALTPQRRGRFLSVPEAAALLGVSEPTLYRAARAGEFPAIKIRGRYVVPAKAIDQLESQAMRAAEEYDPLAMPGESAGVA